MKFLFALSLSFLLVGCNYHQGPRSPLEDASATVGVPGPPIRIGMACASGLNAVASTPQVPRDVIAITSISATVSATGGTRIEGHNNATGKRFTFSMPAMTASLATRTFPAAGTIFPIDSSRAEFITNGHFFRSQVRAGPQAARLQITEWNGAHLKGTFSFVARGPQDVPTDPQADVFISGNFCINNVTFQ